MAEFGLWQSAPGLNPFLTPGLLRTQGDVVDLTASVIVDIPLCSVADGTLLYILGSGGRIYQIADVNTVPVVTEKKNGISNIVKGVAIFQPQGGTKYLYYWQEGQIGRWDLSATYVDNQYTGLQSSTHHPVHKMFDEVYYGNKDRIGRLKDDGAAGVTHTTNVLNFPTESTVTALSDDGTYLIAALTKSTGSTSLYTSSKVIFWDKYASSWNREWTINDPIISALQEKNGLIYAYGSRGVYVFNFSTPPQQIRTDITAIYGYPQQVGLINDAVVLSNYTYGKMRPGVPNALFNPYRGMTGTVTMVASGASSNFVYFGTSSSKLYYYVNDTGASAGNTAPITSSYINLGDRYQITAIDVLRDIPLTSGERFRIDLRTSALASQTTFNEISYTNQGAKELIRVLPAAVGGASAGPVCNSVSVEINPIYGSMRIKQIDLYGQRHPNN